MTQTEHVSLRSQCLKYMILHKDEFQPYLEVPVDHHVYKLQDVREWGGHTEIIAMSRLFK
ncbi:OTU domain-containing protein 4 [Portunus trituberculatus]|uniref:OTU domain-containing protein 4 n=3 Tax=Portunus trituberculatus TaxID=210409 RepID=A0A5B7KCJ0_PORTR|nr:OTU domain-containing protein 4 [Portunus trituberculatus]